MDEDITAADWLLAVAVDKIGESVDNVIDAVKGPVEEEDEEGMKGFTSFCRITNALPPAPAPNAPARPDLRICTV